MTFDLHSLPYISEDFKETNVLEIITKLLSIYGCLISCYSSRARLKRFLKKEKQLTTTSIDHVTLSTCLCNDQVPGHSMNVSKLHYVII